MAHTRVDREHDLRFGGENESDNETVETQHLGENEDQDHADEQPEGIGEKQRGGLVVG